MLVKYNQMMVKSKKLNRVRIKIKNRLRSNHSYLRISVRSKVRLQK